MVEVEAVKTIDLEEIKTRARKLQELVSNLKTDDLVRAQKLVFIRQEKLFLEQQLSTIKTELEFARTQIKLEILESRVLN